jgi:hypothetical protein
MAENQNKEIEPNILDKLIRMFNGGFEDAKMFESEHEAFDHIKQITEGVRNLNERFSGYDPKYQIFDIPSPTHKNSRAYESDQALVMLFGKDSDDLNKLEWLELGILVGKTLSEAHVQGGGRPNTSKEIREAVLKCSEEAIAISGLNKRQAVHNFLKKHGANLGLSKAALKRIKKMSVRDWTKFCSEQGIL